MKDIIFVSFDSAVSDKNWKIIKHRFVYAKKLQYTGQRINEVISEAASIATTKCFWVIYGEVSFLPGFSFDEKMLSWDEQYIHEYKILDNFVPSYGGVYQVSKRYNKALEFKQIKKLAGYINDKLTPKYDIFFISYNEVNATENWDNLQKRFPTSKHISGVTGIHNAHMLAAKESTTDMFWVVDADAEILESFNFSYRVRVWNKSKVHVWKSQNPVNGLVYGYGGVKLLPKSEVLGMDLLSVDMTTSISPRVLTMGKISNITHFNTDPFSSWKSAFRECVKLSSRVINGQVEEDSAKRLDTWCTVGSDALYGDYCISGAIAGKKYGQENAGNIPALSKINDFTWLQQQFKQP